MQRDAFLDHVRQQLADADPQLTAHPIPGGVGVPEVMWPHDDRPLPEQFVAGAEAHGAVARLLRSSREIEEYVAELVKAHAVATAVAVADPGVELVRPVLQRLAVEVTDFDGPASAAVELGVTGAIAGVAATGSVVIDGGRGRSPSLLPDVHLALVRAEDLVPRPSDLWRGLPERFEGSLPSQAVVITGPSKSADVEGVLTVGVHGPRAVWVGVLGS